MTEEARGHCNGRKGYAEVVITRMKFGLRIKFFCKYLIDSQMRLNTYHGMFITLAVKLKFTELWKSRRANGPTDGILSL